MPMPGIASAIVGALGPATPSLSFVGRYGPWNTSDVDLLDDTDAQIGDLVLLFGGARLGSFSPAAGWDPALDNGNRGSAALRVLTAAPTNNIQVISGATNPVTMAYIYRNVPGTPTIVANTPETTGGNPAPQTIALTAVAGPIISFAVAACFDYFGARDLVPFPFERAGVEMDNVAGAHGMWGGNGDFTMRTKHKLDLGSNPGDIIANLSDEGSSNGLGTFLIHF